MNIDTTVRHILSKDISSRKTGRTYKMWSAVLDDGTEVKLGFDKPTFSAGDKIVGVAVANKFGDLEFKPAGSPEAAKASAAPSRGAASTAGVRRFPVDPASPETSIIRQNALTNANAAVYNYHQTTPAKVKSFEDYVDLVIDTAYKFAEFSSGQREVKRVKEMTKSD